MTVEEFMNKPKGMSFEKYDALLKKKKVEEKKARSLSIKIQECEDALQVLADEAGSERYRRWESVLEKYRQEMKRISNGR